MGQIYESDIITKKKRIKTNKEKGVEDGEGEHLLATQISLQANSVVPSSVRLKSLLFID